MTTLWPVTRQGSQRARDQRSGDGVPWADGPMVAVCLLGQPQGRWWAEAHDKCGQSRRLNAALASAVGGQAAAAHADRTSWQEWLLIANIVSYAARPATLMYGP